MKKIRGGESVIVFSMDTDWASDGMLRSAIELFKDRKLPVTVFATHKTAVLEQNDKNVEIGIHPDFFKKGKIERVIEDLLAAYPDAGAVRSHGLFEFSNLMNIYKKFNLRWDSSQLLYLCHHIKPYRHPSGLVRLPIFWEDDDYFSDSPDWNVENLGLDMPGVKCFDFHPIHLALNTVSPAHYCRAKKTGFSNEIVKKAAYKNKDKGILSFFNDLCRYIKMKNLRVSRLGEVCSKYEEFT